MVLDCSDDTMQIEFINNPAFRSALHIPNSVQDWATCSEDVYKNYVRVYMDLNKQYKSLVEQKVGDFSTISETSSIFNAF